MDNAASNTTFIRELQLILHNEYIDFSCEDCHFRCFAHILNLGVQDMLSKLKLNDLEEDKETDSEDEDNSATENDDTFNNPIKKIKDLFLK